MLSNTYLMKDNGIGEGIVIKNYSYKNKYYRVVWAKMVTDEFKEVHRETFGGENQEIESIEQKIVNVFLTNAFIEKEYNKLLLALENEGRVWTNKCIPELLGRIYKEFIDEECFNFIKKFKAPIVNQSTYSKFQKIKWSSYEKSEKYINRYILRNQNPHNRGFYFFIKNVKKYLHFYFYMLL